MHCSTPPQVPPSADTRSRTPAYLKDLRHGGFCVRADKPYSRAQSLLVAAQDYFSQPSDRKAKDSKGDDANLFDGYGASGKHKEMLFLRTSKMPDLIAREGQAFWQWAHALALGVLSDIAQECGVAPQHFLNLVLSNHGAPTKAGTSMLRLFRYCPPTDLESSTLYEHNAHHDLGLLAIGIRTAPGLEAQMPGGQDWVDIEKDLPETAAIVMVGRTLATLTGNRYPSCYHRIVYGDPSRFSAVYQLRVCDTARLYAPNFTNRHPNAPVASFDLTGAQLHHYLEKHCVSVNYRD